MLELVVELFFHLGELGCCEGCEVDFSMLVEWMKGGGGRGERYWFGLLGRPLWMVCCGFGSWRGAGC